MGSISFLLPDPLPEAARETLPTATFAVPGSTGEYEQDPMPASVEVRDGRLVVSRGLSESGYLLVPWPVGPLGTLVAATSTLRETDEPYRLLVELARGKLN